jgi:hypothetical protein
MFMYSKLDIWVDEHAIGVNSVTAAMSFAFLAHNIRKKTK